MGKRDFLFTLIALVVAAIFISSFQASPTGEVTFLNTFLDFFYDDDKREGDYESTCEYKEQANSDGDHCYDDQSCGNQKCCDYRQGNDKECVCKSNKNPCGDGLDSDGNPDPGENNNCMACMGYAEAGGITIPDGCMKAVMCAVQNRVDNPGHKPPVHTACEAVAQGNGQQFNAYKCVCNSKYANQKYCNCCNNSYPNDQEKAEAEKAKDQAANLDCRGFTATHFNNKSQRSWASKSKSCTKEQDPPECQGVFDFYTCSA